MHFRRYALVAAGMLATCFIITAPVSGATWQDNQTGSITISVVIPESETSRTAPAQPQQKVSTSPTDLPSPAKKSMNVPQSIPTATPTHDVVVPPKEQAIDAASNEQKPAAPKPTVSIVDGSPKPVVRPVESPSATPTPISVPTATVSKG